MDKKITVLELLNTGWDWYKKNLWVLIGVGITLFLLSFFYNVISDLISQSVIVALSDGADVPAAKILGIFLLWILFGVVSIILSMGQYAIYLKISKGETAEYRDLFTTYKPFVPFAIMGLLYATATILGLACLIVPGIFLMAIFLFAPYFVLEKGMGPIASLKASIEATSEDKWSLFRWVLFIMAVFGFFFLAIYALNILPLWFTLISALLFTPVFGLGSVSAYRKLVTDQKALIDQKKDDPL